MTIVLSGDVHQTLLGASDQHFTTKTESALAVDYAQIAARYGLKVTLFFTGRAIVDHRTDAQPLLQMENVEIGGHGWDAFRPRLWYGMLNRLIGSPHGPAWLQRRMIRRTCATLQSFSGQPVLSWRNHAYRYDQHTAQLLAQIGVKVWSDQVDQQQIGPQRQHGEIISLPLNTLPDHENLYHGARTREFVNSEQRGMSYHPDEWCDIVCNQVEKIQEARGIATILAHPICMKVADDWTTFERLCAFLSRYSSVFACEITDYPG